MKLGIVYTSTTPELIECVNEEIRKNLGDTPEILNYQDPSILAEVREHGYVTAGAAARLVGMYMQAVSDGCPPWEESRSSGHSSYHTGAY